MSTFALGSPCVPATFYAMLLPAVFPASLSMYCSSSSSPTDWTVWIYLPGRSWCSFGILLITYVRTVFLDFARPSLRILSSRSSLWNPSISSFVLPFQDVFLLKHASGAYSSLLLLSRLIFFSIFFRSLFAASSSASLSAFESSSLDFAYESSTMYSISSSFTHFRSSVAAVARPNSPAFILCFISCKYLCSKSYTNSC